MGQYLEAFLLGNQAILTNVCLLPLYPSLIAFLGGSSERAQAQKGGRWLGVLVLAGVLSMMLLIGLVLYLLNQPFGHLLSVLLPIIYGIVILLGVMMLAGINPFTRLSIVQIPVFKNVFVTAYVYGLLLGPMTLPCTGPLITSAFLLGAGNFAMLTDGLLYFLAFGLGFGWVLVILPFVAIPLQKRFTQWITGHYQVLTRVSGVLLILIGLFGIWTEVLPNLR